MKCLPWIMLLLLSPLAMGETIRLSEPVEVGEGFEVFGAVMADKGPASGLLDIIAAEDEHLGQTVRVQARIAEVCQKKGCFLIATEGDQWARVTFKDYAFFVPTDSSGHRITLEGTFTREEITPEQAAHYAADLGEPAPVGNTPSFEYGIVASSALIRDE